MDNQEILANLHRFLTGASKCNRSCDLELTQTALLLLKTLPASRDAVMEYLCVVFDNAVMKYSSQAQNDQLMNAPLPMNVVDEKVIGEIHEVLCSFLSASSQAWAPIISSWSLKLLGRLSSRYSVYHNQYGLNETIHWWMSCKAARTLIDISTQCLHCLIDTDAEACVSSLLDTSVLYSPFFDWVVALVGACFSKTVITRVLSLGLKDFCSKIDRTSSKFKSIVGILSHLGAGHFIDIRTALLELFLWSLEPGRDVSKKQAVVPFIMLLAEQSSTILNAVSIDILNKLDVSLLESIADSAVNWRTCTEDDNTPLEDMAVSLALRCNRGGAKIISILLAASANENASVACASRILIELLLDGIEAGLGSDRSPSIPIIESLKSDIGQLSPLLLTDDPLRQSTLCRLLRIIGEVNASVPAEAACYLLQHGSTPTHMSTLLHLADHPYSCSNLLDMAIECALRQPKNNLCTNLSHLLQHEKCNNGGADEGIVARAVTNNLGTLSAMVASSEDNLANSVMQVLDWLPSSCLNRLSIQLQLRLITACVKYFFTSIQQQDEVERIIRGARVRSVLENVCLESAAARAAALRELIEASLFLPPSMLFGSKRRQIQRLTHAPYSLSHDNFKLRVRNILSARQSTAFGNGVLSSFTDSDVTVLSTDRIEDNMLQFIELLKSCSISRCTNSPNDRIVSMDAAVQTALLLVSLISPDVMYNGLPWPEEDFCKVTIERDIHIRRVFDELPLAWRVLEMLALQQPALCYCSVLLRALMATLMSQWGSPSVTNRPAVLETTLAILRLMCVGQLLPTPLSALHQVIPFLTSQEVVYLLRGCVWNYMRDNVPSPALFCPDPRSGFMWRDVTTRPPLAYTEPLRMVLLQNMQHFGTLYLNLFVRV